MDGLKGFLDAITTVYPEAQIQLCIVHMVRHSMKFVPWKDYKPVTADLKQIGGIINNIALDRPWHALPRVQYHSDDTDLEKTLQHPFLTSHISLITSNDFTIKGKT